MIKFTTSASLLKVWRCMVGIKSRMLVGQKKYRSHNLEHPELSATSTF